MKVYNGQEDKEAPVKTNYSVSLFEMAKQTMETNKSDFRYLGLTFTNGE
jgi:hypothetical protein